MKALNGARTKSITETFNEKVYKKIWNWHEICDNDINDACERYNLKSYNKEIFDNVAWVCKKKD